MEHGRPRSDEASAGVPISLAMVFGHELLKALPREDGAGSFGSGVSRKRSGSVSSSGVHPAATFDLPLRRDDARGLAKLVGGHVSAGHRPLRSLLAGGVERRVEPDRRDRHRAEPHHPARHRTPVRADEHGDGRRVHRGLLLEADLRALAADHRDPEG